MLKSSGEELGFRRFQHEFMQFASICMIMHDPQKNNLFQQNIAAQVEGHGALGIGVGYYELLLDLHNETKPILARQGRRKPSFDSHPRCGPQGQCQFFVRGVSILTTGGELGELTPSNSSASCQHAMGCRHGQLARHTMPGDLRLSLQEIQLSILRCRGLRI